MNADRLEKQNPRAEGHVLLIAPLYFSYHEAICRSLEQMGYRVTWWNDRVSSATWYKLALRVLPRPTRWLSQGHFLNRLSAASLADVTHVLVVKGEGLSVHVAAEMRRILANVPMGLYLWDSVDNVPGVSRIAVYFDSVSTFDPTDAKQFGWLYRPLFTRFPERTAAPAIAEYDWCFLGTLHSDRHRLIDRLRRASGQYRRVFVFCYSPSKAILWVRRLIDGTLRSAPPGTLSVTPMPAPEVQQIIERSRAVLDIEHPRQRGLTMRTIETLLAGRKIVTTNAHIVDSDLYDPSRVHVIRRDDPSIPQAFIDVEFLPVLPALRSRYSCEGWVTELMSNAEKGFQRRQASPRIPPTF
jgi:hypothetical protein